MNDKVKEIKETISEPNYLLWAILAFLVLSHFGIITSISARIKDMLNGRNI